MKTGWHIVASLAVLLLVLPGPARAETLRDAQQLISQGRYDEAISALRGLITSEPTNAAAAVTLARAYHWKRDLPNAKRWYREAVRLDTRYRLDIVGLLDELEESDEIVRLVAPELAKGNRRPALLGSLLTAYERLGRKAEAAAVVQTLINTSYDRPYDSDYRNYILAYVSLAEGNTSAALSHLGQISDERLRVYARTSPKFQKLRGNADFDKLTR